MGSNLQPSWSPDGRLLAYVSVRGALPGAGSRSLVIHSYESGAERVVAPELGSFVQPRWSPDGRSILVRGRDRDDNWGLHRIDAETGEFLETLPFSDARWSSDGKAVFFKGESGIYRYDPDTEQQSEIYRAERRMPIRFFDVSPDGRWLAFNQMASLRVMAADGGAPREIFRNSGEDSFATLRWSASGRALYFATGPEAKRATLWRLPAEGGEPQAVGIAMDGLRDLSLRPDGRSIAFTAGWPSTELWVMENFLPSPTLAAEDLR